MATISAEDRVWGGGTSDTTDCLLTFLANSLLDKAHYKTVQRALTKRWAKMGSLSSAVKLMETYGVKLTQEEQERLANLEEGRQIEALVMRMPQQSIEQFQQFFLQLQLIVSTAAQVKKALEDKDPIAATRSLESAEMAGISQYILRMAIVQAGSEIHVMHAEYKKWEQDMDQKLGTVMHGQEQLHAAKMKLVAAQTQLEMFQSGHKESQKKLLMNFLSSSSTGLVQSMFHAWKGYVQSTSEEVKIREEYKERIEAAEKRLLEYKSANLKGVRTMMRKKAEDLESLLVNETWTAWKVEIYGNRRTAEDEENIAELEGRLAAVQQSQAENTKRVMARMTGDSNNALVSFCLQAWLAFHKDYLKNKEMEDAVKAEEKRVQEFMRAHGDSAKSIMGAAAGASSTGLLSTCMTAWVKLYQEQKLEAEMCEMLNGADSKFSMFGDRSKAGGMSALDKAAYHLNLLVIIRCWGAWKADTKVEGVHRAYRNRVEAKRQQLLGVQQMFRNFASELETGLKGSLTPKGDMWDRPNNLAMKGPKGGGVSLPDINMSAVAAS